jgi:hypothetical protein
LKHDDLVLYEGEELMSSSSSDGEGS